MANKWIVHVKKTMNTMKKKGTYKKGMGLKQVIKEAKKSWSHVKKGGADVESSSEDEEPVAVAPEGGRHRRKHHKTHRRSKH
jgi:hypothetical protein